MVKLVFLCRRRPDLSHDDYAARVLRGHVPLALRHHPTMQRYVVNLVEEAYDGAPPLDSIAELGFASLADYEQRLYDSPEGERIIAGDVAGFLGGADAYVTRPHDPWPAAPRLGERSAGAKVLGALFDPLDLGREGATSRLAGARCETSHVDRRLGSGPDYATFVSLSGADAGTLRMWLGRLARGHVYRVAEYVQR
jgi:hypothetical protein